MATRTETSEGRTPLTRDRVMAAAVALADREGLDAVSMRKLGAELGVEAMSLYNHVENKDDVLSGMVDLVISEIDLTPPAGDWRTAMRTRILDARSVMLRHKWAPKALETRAAISPPLMRYFHGMLEIFRAGDVSYDLAHHGMHALGSRALGFSTELFEPSSDEEADADMPSPEEMAEFPLMMEMLAEITHDGPDDTVGWCDDQTEFIFVLDLVLDGLERLRIQESETAR